MKESGLIDMSVFEAENVSTGGEALEDVLKEDVPNKECIICFDNFYAGDEITRLDCWCMFHRDCIHEWFDKQNCVACPVHKRDTDQ